MSLNTNEAVYKLKNIPKNLLTKTCYLYLEKWPVEFILHIQKYISTYYWDLNLIKEKYVRFDDLYITAENVDNLIWKFS